MSILKYTNRLRYIDFLLRTKAAGNTKCLAKKLVLSRSSTLEFIKEMRELGFPIKYCSKRQCYHYYNDGKMVKHLFKKSDDNDIDDEQTNRHTK